MSHSSSSRDRPSGVNSVSQVTVIEGEVQSGVGAQQYAILQRLFDLAVENPGSRSAEQLAQHVLDTVGPSFPGCALGVCVVDGASQTRFTRRWLPNDEPPPSENPSRLFPTFRYETTLSLGSGLPDSSFHVASNDHSLADPSTLLQSLSDVARLMGTLVRRALDTGAEPAAEQRVRALRAQLIQAEKLSSLGQVVAGVVHELGNPLTSIVAYANYLQDRARQKGEADDLERLTRISESAERMLEFTRDLVAYARPASDIPGHVDIHSIINKAMTFCEHEFERSQAKIQLELCEGLHPVRGVAAALTQVFVNLLTNAAHALETHGGQISVVTRVDPGVASMIVQVTDNGMGIPEEVRSQIFEPFFTTKDDDRGTGLGLVIVSEIIESHSGKVEVASTPGEGTTFTIHLPLAHSD